MIVKITCVSSRHLIILKNFIVMIVKNDIMSITHLYSHLYYISESRLLCGLLFYV